MNLLEVLNELSLITPEEMEEGKKIIIDELSNEQTAAAIRNKSLNIIALEGMKIDCKTMIMDEAKGTPAPVAAMKALKHNNMTFAVLVKRIIELQDEVDVLKK